MARNKQARPLLTDVINLIARDIEHIEKIEGKLDAETSTCLVKYSDALLKIVRDEDGQLADERAAVAKMSNEDLAKLAKQLTDKK